jgi:hypothetical protein
LQLVPPETLNAFIASQDIQDARARAVSALKLSAWRVWALQSKVSDLSVAEVERARAEAAIRKLQINFRVDDMRTLQTASLCKYGVVLAFDNSLPHLDSDADVQSALAAMRTDFDPGVSCC